MPDRLDVCDAVLPYRLEFRECDFAEGIDGERLDVHHLCLLGGTHGPAPNGAATMNLDRAQVAHELQLTGAVRGEVRLLGAHIDGQLGLRGATLTNPDGDALNADGARIGGGAFLDEGFTAQGEVRLPGTQIDGQLSLSGAKLTNPDGFALAADGARIGGDAFLHEGFTAQGEVRLVGAHIAGQLILRGATLINPNGDALYAYEARTGGASFLDGTFGADGRVVLDLMTIGGDLFVRSEKPLAIHADGLTVEGDLHDTPGREGRSSFMPRSCSGMRLGGLGSWDIEHRLAWLGHVGEDDAVQVDLYDHLADLLTRHGRAGDATRILLDKERRLTRHGGFGRARRIWRRMVEATTGHGYRHLRVLPWAMGLAAIASTTMLGLRTTAHAGGLLAQSDLSPTIYRGTPEVLTTIGWSIDAAIPVVNLGFDDAIRIAEGHPFTQAAYALIIGAGWLLGAVFAAGYTSRAIRAARD